MCLICIMYGDGEKWRKNISLLFNYGIPETMKTCNLMMIRDSLVDVPRKYLTSMPGQRAEDANDAKDVNLQQEKV